MPTDEGIPEQVPHAVLPAVGAVGSPSAPLPPAPLGIEGTTGCRPRLHWGLLLAAAPLPRVPLFRPVCPVPAFPAPLGSPGSVLCVLKPLREGRRQPARVLSPCPHRPGGRVGLELPTQKQQKELGLAVHMADGQKLLWAESWRLSGTVETPGPYSNLFSLLIL